MAVRTPSETRHSKSRSAVSNGRELFVEGTGRSAWARRYRDIFEAHMSDLGGSAQLSEAQIQLCRRAASLAIESERLEGKLADGKTVDIDLLGRLAGHLGRAYDRLGIERRARTVNNPLLDHFSRPPDRSAA